MCVVSELFSLHLATVVAEFSLNAWRQKKKEQNKKKKGRNKKVKERSENKRIESLSSCRFGLCWGYSFKSTKLFTTQPSPFLPACAMSKDQSEVKA